MKPPITDHDIIANIDSCLVESNFSGTKHRGKVRDTYDLGDKLLLITTDRLSAFDRLLATIPFKGQVLNELSTWWLQQTRDLVPNHWLATPDPNAMLVKKCRVIPVEMVVRQYITGSTNTALWTLYAAGEREICGNHLPEGLKKNARLPEIILTPTTKDPDHDEPMSPAQLIANGYITELQWQTVSDYALKLFKFGAKVASECGLLLVDTKYEFGIDENDQIILIDEIHTADSSRYWHADSYAERVAQALEPDSLDKEILRLWYKDNCDPYADKPLPMAPQELVVRVARAYLTLFERLTGVPLDWQTDPNTRLQNKKF